MRSTAFCAGLLFLAACQSPPGVPAAAVGAAPILSTAPPNAQATRYSILAESSDVRFLVYRAGPMASFGHNHVIQAKTLVGDIVLAEDFHQSNFHFAIPVADLQVDAAAARSAEGDEFAKLPDAEAIAGTTRNMLGSKVLDAAFYPQIEIRSVAVTGPAGAPDVTVRVKLRGVERDITMPLAIDYRDDQIAVTALFAIDQTDFGITPLSLLGGALQVANRVRVRLRIVARKA